MATYNLRRFAQPAVLKAIAPKRLQEFLGPYRTYFDGRGLPLPSPNASNGLDHEQLVEVLMTPDADTPKDLVDALFFVNEMSTDENMDLLLEEAETKGLSLDGKPDPTAADVAVQVFLQDRQLLERKHAEQYLTRPRVFEYFQTQARPVPAFKQPSWVTLVALEHDLDNWFEKKKRGRVRECSCIRRAIRSGSSCATAIRSGAKAVSTATRCRACFTARRNMMSWSMNRPSVNSG